MEKWENSSDRETLESLERMWFVEDVREISRFS
jgi:hypothetical protein